MLRDKKQINLVGIPDSGQNTNSDAVELGLEANLYDPDIRWSTKESYISSLNTLLSNTVKPGRKDHPRKLFWIPSGFYEPELGYEEVQRRYVEDSKTGVFDEYKQSTKNTYYEECKVFWEGTERRYKEEVNASKILLAEMPANRTTNDDTRKHKHPSDDEDMKPASKP